jgi:hypothetical protein
MGLLFAALVACSGSATEPAAVRFRPPRQTVDQCSLLTREEVANAVLAKVTAVRTVDMMGGGQGCMYDTESSFDQVTVFVADNWEDVFERQSQQPSTEPLSGVGDAAFVTGKARVTVLVGSRYLSVGARLPVPKQVHRLAGLATRAAERLEARG